jgi:hypothetical protein
MLSNEILPKFCSKFFCEICDYYTSKKSSYNDHLLSTKHQKSMVYKQNSNPNLLNSAPQKYTCQFCNKEYKDNSGLWRHKNKGNCSNKICIEQEDNKKTEEMIEIKEIMKYLMKENSEMKNMILEVVKNGTTNNSVNTTHTNSHNKAFNLNFFLNETCKDAMNIGEFVDSLKLQLSDLEKVGEDG